MPEAVMGLCCFLLGVDVERLMAESVPLCSAETLINVTIRLVICG